MEPVYDYMMTKTRAGLALDQKLPNSGTHLTFTKAKAGAGSVALDTLNELTDLVDVRQELILNPILPGEEDTTIIVPVTLSNRGLTEGYTVHQIGVYAEDPDLGEILYQVAQSTKPEGEVIPSEASSPGFSIDWDLDMNVANADTVQVSVSEAGRLTVKQGDNRYAKKEDVANLQEEVIPLAEKGKPGGVAELDDSGNVLSAQLPSYVDDVLEYDTLTDFPEAGESGKIYVAKDTNITYRWSGTGYVEVGPSLALGETASTAYRGDKGKALEIEVNKLKETHVTTTLAVSGWNTSTKVYSFESTYPAATYDVEIEPINCNEAQAKAWGKMCPMTGSTSSNQLQIFGTVPTIELPVLLTVRTK